MSTASAHYLCSAGTDIPQQRTGLCAILRWTRGIVRVVGDDVVPLPLAQRVLCPHERRPAAAVPSLGHT